MIRKFLLTLVSFLLLIPVIPVLPAEKIDVKKVRELLRHLGGADFRSEQVQIRKISSGIAGDVVVEAQIETAYRVVRDKNEWRVADIRLGDRHWESFELIEEAVRREKVRRTLGLLEEVGGAIDAYREREGRYVEADRITVLLDAISPRFLTTPHRLDLWGEEFDYKGSLTGFRLRSAGPDAKFGTGDDLAISGGAGR